MEYDGIILDRISPKMVLNEAYKSKYIDDIDMINDRNLLSHTYDYKVFEEIIPDIQTKYTPLLSNLYPFLIESQL